MARNHVGQIGWLWVGGGVKVKERPVLILDVGDPRIPDDLLVVGITGDKGHHCPPYHVVISDFESCGLTKQSVIKCNWRRWAHPDRVKGPYSYLDSDLLNAALDGYDLIDLDPKFDGWF